MSKIKKKTREQLLTEMLQSPHITENEEWREFLAKELYLIVSKAKRRKLTKEEEHTSYGELIKEILYYEGRPMSLRSIQKQDNVLIAMSNQKLSSILKVLVDNQEIKRVIFKKKAYYILNEWEDYEDEEIGL